MVEKSKKTVKKAAPKLAEKPVKAFEVNEKVILELVDLASEPGSEGRVKKGVNVTTKAIEKGMAKIVIIADDVEPKAVIAHIPLLCKDKEVPLLHVSSKTALGSAARLEVGCSSITITEPGLGKELFLKMKKAIGNA